METAPRVEQREDSTIMRVVHAGGRGIPGMLWLIPSTIHRDDADQTWIGLAE